MLGYTPPHLPRNQTTPIPQSKQPPSPGTRGRHPQDLRQTPPGPEADTLLPSSQTPPLPRADTFPGADSLPLTPEADTPRTRGRHPPEQTHSPEQTPPSLGSRHPPRSRPPCPVCAGRYRQQAGGTHPTGMHTCYVVKLGMPILPILSCL